MGAKKLPWKRMNEWQKADRRVFNINVWRTGGTEPLARPNVSFCNFSDRNRTGETFEPWQQPRAPPTVPTPIRELGP